MKIVFMGTPDFAVESLKALYEAGHEIVGVFTQPDKPQGRKMILTPPPVKVYAESVGLKVYQPKSVKTEESYELLKSFDADLFAVVAYGKILPKAVLDLPKFCCVNVHASILPRHRGASPIQWSIYCGDKETGVTTQAMDEGIDTGDILLVEKTEINNDDNFETLHDRLALMGAKLLVDTIKGIEDKTIKPQKQPEEGACYAPIITKEMGQIDFNLNANEIDCRIRAFTPWPSAFFYIDGTRIKVLRAKIGQSTNQNPGTVVGNSASIAVACNNGSVIEFVEIQPEGKGRMDAKAYLNGKPLSVGTKLC
jgi:methionyl-tRNA formyltransferase